MFLNYIIWELSWKGLFINLVMCLGYSQVIRVGATKGRYKRWHIFTIRHQNDVLCWLLCCTGEGRGSANYHPYRSYRRWFLLSSLALGCLPHSQKAEFPCHILLLGLVTNKPGSFPYNQQLLKCFDPISGQWIGTKFTRSDVWWFSPMQVNVWKKWCPSLQRDESWPILQVTLVTILQVTLVTILQVTLVTIEQHFGNNWAALW